MTQGTLIERLERVEAQLAIQQLAARYAHAVDSRDLDALAGIFSPDVDFGLHGRGPDATRAFFDSPPALRAFYRSLHQICGHVIELVDADHARGSVYCRAEHEDGAHWVVQLMVYFDRYERIDGRWYISGRAPRWLHTGDLRERPQDAAFNDWIGRTDGADFGPHLPQGYKSWAPFWERHPEDVALRTRHP